MREITDTLRTLKQGALTQEATELLALMVKKVEQTGKAGKLTITIDVKKVGGVIGLLGKVTDKTPQPVENPELFYADEHGGLTVDNPAQRKLDLKPVVPTKTPLAALQESAEPTGT